MGIKYMYYHEKIHQLIFFWFGIESKISMKKENGYLIATCEVNSAPLLSDFTWYLIVFIQFIYDLIYGLFFGNLSMFNIFYNIELIKDKSRWNKNG